VKRRREPPHLAAARAKKKASSSSSTQDNREVVEVLELAVVLASIAAAVRSVATELEAMRLALTIGPGRRLKLTDATKGADMPRAAWLEDPAEKEDA
jgi:hypothetical protein